MPQVTEVKEQKETTVDKATDTETDNYYMRILIKTAKILTFTNLHVKAMKELKMLQKKNSQMLLMISLPLKQNRVLIADLAMLPAGNQKKKLLQHRQVIMAGIVSAALLVVVGIAGWVLLCIILSSLTQS